MPVYEYVCVDCGHRFEQQRKVTERSTVRCPECRGQARKLFGAVGIIFKGSGFHSTDYRTPEDAKGRAEDAKGKAEDAKGKERDAKGKERDGKPASASSVKGE